jgi:hypothetical protein
MAVEIADVAALLELVLFRRRQEFSTPALRPRRPMR